jgi:asparagine synthase (glutamine-hydrolysing)
MCGICGVLNFNRQEHVDGRALESMNNVIVHRGPDDAGFYSVENAGLAMRRLSIIDIKTGHQPLSNEDGTVWIVFNGEIYNYRDLRTELAGRRHRFQSHSDTETIIHLYEEHGRECVQYLRGMFAFALWDARRRVLFAARDRLGIKPFYYHLSPSRFIFGSEIKALLAFPEVRAELNPAILPEYLAFGYISGSETFFRGIHKLLPGHMLELKENGDISISTYWDLPQEQRWDHRPKKYYIDTYRSLLEESVESHLMSDVPLGMFLSGGLDSSVIAALMTKLRREPIETFSVGYAEAPFSELPHAQAVARHLGSLHHEVRIGWQDFFNVLPKLIWHEDEPLAWPSSVSLYFVAKLARERVTVVLTGEGSDETLAGYTRYAWTLWNAHFDRGYRHLLSPGIRSLVRTLAQGSNGLPSKLQRVLKHTFLARDGARWTSFYFDNFFSAFAEAEQQNLLNDKFGAEAGAPYRNSLAYWNKASGSLLSRLLYTDIKTYLVELLMKQDNMSMAASVESRVPFLDHVLVEFARSIPAPLQTHGLAGKCILKAIAEDFLPKSIIHRRKMGFPTPLRQWLAGPHLDDVERLLLEPRSLEWGVFKPESLKCLFAEHRSGTKDRYEQLWRLMNLELWRRVFLDRNPLPTRSQS